MSPRTSRTRRAKPRKSEKPETSAKSRSSRKRPAAAPPLEYSLLLTATLCLLALGAVMVFSASSARSLLAGGGDGAYYFKRTLIFAAIGLLAMRVLSVRGTRLARVLTPALLVISMLGLFAVLVPGIGVTVNGSQRWIGAGLFQVQPSELAKVALILYGAHLLTAEPKRVRTLKGLGPYLLVTGTACLLISREPDLGSSLVIGFSVFSLLIAGGVRLRTLAPVAAVIATAGLLMVATHPYQAERLTGFMNPSSEPTGAGFQAQQAKIAIGSGEVFGRGLGRSVQKASYLPEAHTDMIAAVIGEETGLIGMGILMGLFGLFGWAGFRAAFRARDRYAKLVAAGLTSAILTQSIVNLFAVMGLAPVTGVPLPFVSYGGSSLVVTLGAVGLLLNIARTRGIDAVAVPRGESSSRRTASSTQKTRRAGAGRSGTPARLRAIEGGTTGRTKKRRAPAARRDRSGRDRRPRRAGDRSRGRAAG